MISSSIRHVSQRRHIELRMVCTIALSVAAATIAVPLAYAQQPHGESPDSSHTSTTVVTDPRAAQPERPTIATHAYTVAPGYVEIETGVQEMRPTNTSQFAAPIAVKFGVTPRLQLEIQGGYTHNTASSTSPANAGATDIAVALKQRLLDAAPLIQDLSLQGSIKFATGAHNVSTGTTDLSILLISSRQIGAAELDLNAGYTHRSGDGSTVPLDATLLTASLGAPIFGAVGGVAELFSYPGTSGPTDTPPAVGFLTGPTLQLKPWLVLDVGVILNVQHMQANTVYAGVTYNIGRIPGLPTTHR